MTTTESFIWGDLLHLGMNMWCDWKNPQPLGYGWEETVIRWPSDTVRADMSIWRDWTDAMEREKLNMAVIDIGEAFVYPSHPELAAKGALTPEKMRADVPAIGKRLVNSFAPAYPFLRPAIENHKDEYHHIIIEELNKIPK